MAKSKPLPLLSRMRELFSYHEDGYLIRLLRTGPTTFVGQEVRGTMSGSYLRARVDSEQYLLHRLIYQWHHGWCPGELDHEDRDPGNCRIGNLRDLTRSENVLNSGKRRNNTTGVSGVYKDQYGQFYAAPTRGGVRHRPLGRFNTVEEAAASLEEFE